MLMPVRFPPCGLACRYAVHSLLLTVFLVLKKLVRARKKELELQGELSKKDEQLAESLAQRKTEKALADTERKRAELKLSV